MFLNVLLIFIRFERKRKTKKININSLMSDVIAQGVLRSQVLSDFTKLQLSNTGRSTSTEVYSKR